MAGKTIKHSFTLLRIKESFTKTTAATYLGQEVHFWDISDFPLISYGLESAKLLSVTNYDKPFGYYTSGNNYTTKYCGFLEEYTQEFELFPLTPDEAYKHCGTEVLIKAAMDRIVIGKLHAIAPKASKPFIGYSMGTSYGAIESNWCALIPKFK